MATDSNTDNNQHNSDYATLRNSQIFPDLLNSRDANREVSIITATTAAVSAHNQLASPKIQGLSKPQHALRNASFSSLYILFWMACIPSVIFVLLDSNVQIRALSVFVLLFVLILRWKGCCRTFSSTLLVCALSLGSLSLWMNLASQFHKLRAQRGWIYAFTVPRITTLMISTYTSTVATVLISSLEYVHEQRNKTASDNSLLLWIEILLFFSVPSFSLMTVVLRMIFFSNPPDYTFWLYVIFLVYLVCSHLFFPDLTALDDRRTALVSIPISHFINIKTLHTATNTYAKSAFSVISAFLLGFATFLHFRVYHEAILYSTAVAVFLYPTLLKSHKLFPCRFPLAAVIIAPSLRSLNWKVFTHYDHESLTLVSNASVLLFSSIVYMRLVFVERRLRSEYDLVNMGSLILHTSLLVTNTKLKPDHPWQSILLLFSIWNLEFLSLIESQAAMHKFKAILAMSRALLSGFYGVIAHKIYSTSYFAVFLSASISLGIAQVFFYFYSNRLSPFTCIMFSLVAAVQFSRWVHLFHTKNMVTSWVMIIFLVVSAQAAQIFSPRRIKQQLPKDRQDPILPRTSLSCIQIISFLIILAVVDLIFSQQAEPWQSFLPPSWFLSICGFLGLLDQIPAKFIPWAFFAALLLSFFSKLTLHFMIGAIIIKEMALLFSIAGVYGAKRSFGMSSLLLLLNFTVISINYKDVTWTELLVILASFSVVQSIFSLKIIPTLISRKHDLILERKTWMAGLFLMFLSYFVYYAVHSASLFTSFNLKHTLPNTVFAFLFLSVAVYIKMFENDLNRTASVIAPLIGWLSAFCAIIFIRSVVSSFEHGYLSVVSVSLCLLLPPRIGGLRSNNFLNNEISRVLLVIGLFLIFYSARDIRDNFHLGNCLLVVPGQKCRSILGTWIECMTLAAPSINIFSYLKRHLARSPDTRKVTYSKQFLQNSIMIIGLLLSNVQSTRLFCGIALNVQYFSEIQR